MSLSLKRLEGETWKDAALRYAKPHGLEWEVETFYEQGIAAGQPDFEAAFDACLEWDVLDFIND